MNKATTARLPPCMYPNEDCASLSRFMQPNPSRGREIKLAITVSHALPTTFQHLAPPIPGHSQVQGQRQDVNCKLPTQAVPWLRSLIAGLSERRPRFAPGSIHVGFVVDKVALGQVSLRVLRFSPVSIIPPSLSKLISSGG
jgi:hypothetical protein